MLINKYFLTRYLIGWQHSCQPIRCHGNPVELTQISTCSLWLWNDAQSLKQHRRGALLFFKVICQISRSHVTKKSSILTWIERFRTVTLVWIHWWQWNDAQSLKQHKRGALLFLKVICQISRSHGTKNHWFFTQIEQCRTVTPVWIHRWLWNDAQSLT